MPEPKLLIASTNPGKVAEYRLLREGLGMEIVGPEALEREIPPFAATGASFRENAAAKAGHWHTHSGLPVLADDSGLAVDSLDGAPGVYSARFAGPRATDQQNVACLLECLREVKKPSRGATFHCCLALCRSDDSLVFFEGICRGEILTLPAGTSGFGYDPVFYYPPLAKTFAQLSPAKKNQVSHRALALKAFRNWLATNQI